MYVRKAFFFILSLSENPKSLVPVVHEILMAKVQTLTLACAAVAVIFYLYRSEAIPHQHTHFQPDRPRNFGDTVS